MDDRTPFDPGSLELFALGALAPDEMAQIRAAMALDVALRAEVEDIQHALEALAWAGSVEPPSALRKEILKGTAPRPMCVIDDTTRTADLPEWLFTVADPDPASYTNMHVEYLDCPADVPSALVWVKHYVEEEEHTDCRESFHILEGTCEVLWGDNVRLMVPGDSIAIPLHTPHSVRVTSPFPCKAVVQRRPLLTV